MYKRLTEEGGVIPALNDSETLKDKVSILWFNVPQPWHPQSPVLHEASFAVKRLDASKFNLFCGMLFNAQPQFVDKVVFDKSRKQLIEELSVIGAEAGVDKV